MKLTLVILSLAILLDCVLLALSIFWNTKSGYSLRAQITQMVLLVFMIAIYIAKIILKIKLDWHYLWDILPLAIFVLALLTNVYILRRRLKSKEMCEDFENSLNSKENGKEI